MCCSPPVPAAYGFGPAVQGGADGADPGRSGKYHAPGHPGGRRTAGGRPDPCWRDPGPWQSITRRDDGALLNLSDTAAYLRLRRLVGRRELEQVGKKYYLPGTVVPEEKQWEVISAYLQEAGFAYCQDVAELLHVGKRKTAGILRRMVRDGQLLQFEKRYYLAKQPGQKQIQ